MTRGKSATVAKKEAASATPGGGCAACNKPYATVCDDGRARHLEADAMLAQHRHQLRIEDERPDVALEQTHVALCDVI